MVRGGARSQSQSQISTGGLQSKFKCIVSRHHAMKSTFLQLKSQIQISLFHAEEVFTSLSVPLMRLVGLKTTEMAEDGRFTYILMKECWSDGVAARYLPRSLSSDYGSHWSDQNLRLKEESRATEAIMTCKELEEKQRLQIIQLVHLLRQIETQVNSHHGDIRQTLAEHGRTLHKSFQTAISYVAAIHHSGQNQENFHLISNVFQIMFRKVYAALKAMESGLEDMMQQLALQMCNPMVEYMKGLKTEIVTPHINNVSSS